MANPPTLSKRLLQLTLLVVALSTVYLALTTDRKQLWRTFLMFSNIKPNQALELMRGVGEVGVLAEGSGSPMVIVEGGVELPTVLGTQPVVRKPLPPLPMPDHPFMLDEYASAGVHADNYNSSVSPLPGPLGLKPIASVVKVMDDDIGMCTPLMRDLKDRLASVCISLGGPSKLVLFDPADNFKILAEAEIPKRRSLIDPAGGWYSRMDHLGRPIVPTPAQDIRAYEVVEEDGKHRWEIVEQWDMSGVLPKDVSPSDVVPDWDGNYWFISGFGHAGHLNRQTGKSRVIELGGGDETSPIALTVGSMGAFVLTSKALYLLGLAADGTPTPTWRWAYGESGSIDLSTPTLLDEGKLIAFSIDGLGDRAQLIVLKTGAGAMENDARVACRMPMFKPNRSSIKNTLIGYGRSIVAQNNYGGDFFEIMDFEPGLARVDVRADHSGCDLVWEEYTVASQVPPRLSTGDGHVYQYSRRRGTPDGLHAWYLSAFDFETGAVVSELFVATGKGVDSPMLSSDFWPGGVYVGGIRNGIVTLRDGEVPPPVVEPAPEEEEAAVDEDESAPVGPE